MILEETPYDVDYLGNEEIVEPDYLIVGSSCPEAESFGDTYHHVRRFHHRSVDEMDEDLQEGHAYYMISAHWLTNLHNNLELLADPDPKKADQLMCALMAPVSNKELVAVVSPLGPVLYRNMVERKHYFWISELLWKDAIDIFGGGPEILRVASDVGISLVGDVHFKIWPSRDPKSFIRMETDGGCVKDILSAVKNAFGIDQDAGVRVWSVARGRLDTMLTPEEMSASLNSVDICLAIEEQSDTDHWGFDNFKRLRQLEPGLVGLYNLRNTCYMNSILQCVSHIPSLREYFMSGKYVAEINETNVLGTKGELAHSFATLLDSLWAENTKAVSPLEFRNAIASLREEFSGSEQHDSQEFLSFLMDGLHEDLNRVKVKEYSIAVDSANRKDEILAQEAVDLYANRNDSVISDMCVGMLKSTLQCRNNCDNVSVTFDPYMILPLPVSNGSVQIKTLRVWVSSAANPWKLVNVGLKIPRSGPCIHIRNAAARVLKGNRNHFFMCEFANNKIIRVLSDALSISALGRETDIMIVEDVNAAHHLSWLHYVPMNNWDRPVLAITNDMLSATSMSSNIKLPTKGKAMAKDLLYTELDTAKRRLNVGFRNIVNRTLETQGSRCIFRKGQIWFGNFDQPSSRTTNGVRLEVVAADIQKDGCAVLVVIIDMKTDTYEETRVLKGSYTPAESDTISAGTKTRSGSLFSPRHMTKSIFASLSRRKSNVADPPPTEETPPNADPILTFTAGSFSLLSEPFRILRSLSKSEAEYAEELVPAEMLKMEGTVDSSSDICFGDFVHQLGSTAFYMQKQALKNAFQETADSSLRAIRYVSRLETGNSHDLCLYEFPPGILTAPSTTTKRQAIDLVFKHVMECYNVCIGDNDLEPFTHISMLEPFLRVVKAGSNYMLGSDVNDLYCDEEASAFGRNCFIRIHLVWKNAATNPVVRVLRQMNDFRKASLQAVKYDESIDLTDCLKLFCKEESLSGNDAWYCSKCQVFTDSVKMLQIWSFPPILVIHLKRFSHYAEDCVDKLEILVKFPLENLELDGFALGGRASMYDLFAVSNHYGGLSSGHYTCFARSEVDSKWYEFDDDIVVPVGNVENICSKAAYVLFYIRRDKRPLSWKQ